ncbi:hypothetical protein ACTXMZ_15620 [Brachybacterium alimentarium]|uniref:hypothetical protein n=1 Tax=Brachybacterium alimentarium TaxID=47845 RepID=UPI003FD67CCE
MTTDDKTLTEQIARALAAEEGYELPWEQERHAGLYREQAAAVLPIIRKAERDAAREALTTLAAEHQARSVGNGLISDMHLMAQQRAEAWRDHAYPEETP